MSRSTMITVGIASAAIGLGTLAIAAIVAFAPKRVARVAATTKATLTKPLETKPAATMQPDNGGGCVLRSDLPELFATTDDDSSEALARASARRDGLAVQSLILSGKVYVVTSGTKAHIVERRSLTSRVRITDGQMAGKVLIVANEFVQTR